MGFVALPRAASIEQPGSWRPFFEPGKVDWKHLVTIDFETYYDDDYTLRKLTTSEYIRDQRFEAIFAGVRVGTGKTRVLAGPDIAPYLRGIDWATHDLLCHHTQFDGFILSHHYGVVPRFYYCSLSMARGWLANDIGAGLDAVSKFFGRKGKLDGGAALVDMKGKHLKDLTREERKAGKEYCAQDNDECYSIFREHLLPEFSQPELDLIDATVQMFTCPVIKLDEARARKALAQELEEKKKLLLEVSLEAVDDDALKSRCKKELKAQGLEVQEDGEAFRVLLAKKVIGSSPRFARLLQAEGVDPPIKISPAWLKLGPEDREAAIDKKYAYAFASTDLDFVALSDDQNPRVGALVDARLSVKSTITVARAARLLASGAGGRSVPVYYKYAGAHTWRFSGGDRQNFQNFTRGGELRQSLLAPAGHVLCVQDSSQIEARVNAWLWNQSDLVEAFQLARDVYSEFASTVYGRVITKADVAERFLGKTATLGLGFGMGHVKFRATLARGKTPVNISEPMAQSVVQTYRKMNSMIVHGWAICDQIIEQMYRGVRGEYKCIRWEHETIWLPNGMRLKYPRLHMNEDGQWVYKRKDQWIKLYGGILCENIVQALARIIVAAEQLLKISRVHPIVMTTHDEIVALVKYDKRDPLAFTLEKPHHHAELAKLRGPAAEAMRFMHRTMCTAPAWCPDLPLAAEGGWAVNYSK